MKRTLAAALTALMLCLGGLIPGGSPAMAATAGPSIVFELDTAPATYRPGYATYRVHVTNAQGYSIRWEYFSDGVWRERYTSDPVTSAVVDEYFQDSLDPGESRTSRVVLLSGTSTAATSREVTVTYDPAHIPPGITPGDYDSEPATAGTAIPFQVYGSKGAVVKLQRKDGAVWTAVWASAALAGNDLSTVTAQYRFPKQTAATFRAVVVRAGKTIATSASVVIRYAAPSVRIETEEASDSPVRTLDFSGDHMEGATVALQRLDKKLWKTVWTSPPVTWSTPSTRYSFSAEGTLTFRAVMSRAGRTVATSPSTRISYARRTTQVWSPWQGLFAAAAGRVAAGNQVADTITLGFIDSVRTGAFQEYRSGRWVTLQKLVWKVPRPGGMPSSQTVKTVLTTATAVKKYRFIVSATPTEKAYTSATATISHENPARYTGYKLASYNYMKKYCTRQIIELKGPGYSLTWSGSLKIQMAVGYGTGKGLQYVSLHECAHVRQFRLYQDNYAGLAHRMNQIYGGSNGLEQQADCMSYLMGADRNYGGHYTKNCAGYRGKAAALVLAGKKP